MTYTAYDDGNVKIMLKCGCTCWYCLCTLEGHCGNNDRGCDCALHHPEDFPRT